MKSLRFLATIALLVFASSAWADPISSKISYPQFQTLIKQKVREVPDLQQLWNQPGMTLQVHFTGGAFRGLLLWLHKNLQTHTFDQVMKMRPPSVSRLLLQGDADRDLLAPDGLVDRVRSFGYAQWDVLPNSFFLNSVNDGGAGLDRAAASPLSIRDHLYGLENFYYGNLNFIPKPVGNLNGNTPMALALRYLRFVKEFSAAAQPDPAAIAQIRSVGATANLPMNTRYTVADTESVQYWVKKALSKFVKAYKDDYVGAFVQLRDMALLGPLGERNYFAGGVKIRNPIGLARELAKRGFSTQEQIWAGRMLLSNSVPRAIEFHKELIRLAKTEGDRLFATWGFMPVPSPLYRFRMDMEILKNKNHAVPFRVISHAGSLGFKVCDLAYTALKLQPIGKQGGLGMPGAVGRALNAQIPMGENRVFPVKGLVAIGAIVTTYGAAMNADAIGRAWRGESVTGPNGEKPLHHETLDSAFLAKLRPQCEPADLRLTFSALRASGDQTLSQRCHGILARGCYITTEHYPGCDEMKSEAGLNLLAEFATRGENIQPDLFHAIATRETPVDAKALDDYLAARNHVFTEAHRDHGNIDRQELVRMLQAHTAGWLSQPGGTLAPPPKHLHDECERATLIDPASHVSATAACNALLEGGEGLANDLLQGKILPDDYAKAVSLTVQANSIAYQAAQEARKLAAEAHEKSLDLDRVTAYYDAFKKGQTPAVALKLALERARAMQPGDASDELWKAAYAALDGHFTPSGANEIATNIVQHERDGQYSARELLSLFKAFEEFNMQRDNALKLAKDVATRAKSGVFPVATWLEIWRANRANFANAQAEADRLAAAAGHGEFSTADYAATSEKLKSWGFNYPRLSQISELAARRIHDGKVDAATLGALADWFKTHYTAEEAFQQALESATRVRRGDLDLDALIGTSKFLGGDFVSGEADHRAADLAAQAKRGLLDLEKFKRSYAVARKEPGVTAALAYSRAWEAAAE